MRRQKYEPHLHLRSRDCRLTQFKPDVMDIDVERTFSPKISPHSPRSRWMTFGALGYEERICWANCMRNWFPRFSTYVVTIHQRHRRTDRQTDDMRSQDRSLHYSASRGKNSHQCLYHYLEENSEAKSVDAHTLSRFVNYSHSFKSRCDRIPIYVNIAQSSDVFTDLCSRPRPRPRPRPRT